LERRLQEWHYTFVFFVKLKESIKIRALKEDDIDRLQALDTTLSKIITHNISQNFSSHKHIICEFRPTSNVYTAFWPYTKSHSI